MKNRRRLITLLLILACGVAGASHQNAPASQKTAEPDPVVIPFELVTRHILIRVRINNSAPLWFIFDTGDKVATLRGEEIRLISARGATPHEVKEYEG